MLITHDADVNRELTEEEIKMFEALKDSPVTPDEDCPELTKEQLSRFKKVSKEKKVTVRLSPQAFQKAQTFGEDYLTVLSDILEKALVETEK